MSLTDPEIARLVSKSGAISNGDIDYIKLTNNFEVIRAFTIMMDNALSFKQEATACSVLYGNNRM